MARGDNEQRDRDDKGERRRLLVTLAVSIGLHVLALAIALPFWLASRDLDGISRGAPDFVMVTGEEPQKALEPSLEPPTKEPTPLPQRHRQAAVDSSRSRPLTTTSEPAERSSDTGEEDTSSEPMTVAVTMGGGDPRGRTNGDSSLNPGYGVLDGSLTPRPECLDGLDNDGDRLIDSEDPGCLPPPETAEEEVMQRTKAVLLSDMRRNDPLRGDPDEIVRQRMTKGLRDRPDGGLIYEEGGFRAEIDPDGEIRFSRRRRPGSAGFGFDLGGPPRSRQNVRQKLRFLEATAEARDELDQRRRHRDMKRALYGLRGDLTKIWRDRRLSVNQKKTILFQRLVECDRETTEGQDAARTIIEFIREYSRTSRVDVRPGVSPPLRRRAAPPPREQEIPSGALAAPP